MNTQRVADAAVVRGIAWLNKHSRQWRGKIDVTSLDLIYPCQCVLGQLDGDFYQALWDRHLSRAEAKRFGFAAPDGVPYRTLTAAWKRALRRLDDAA